MGLSYIAIACPIEALASVYASRDEALFARIATSDLPGVRHYLHLDRPGPVGFGGVPEHLRALHDLFVGAACTRGRPHEYGYALAACALALGEELGAVHGGYGRHGAASALLGAHGERDDVLPLMDVVWPVEARVEVPDWPMYEGVPAAEVARRAAGLRAVLARLPTSLDDEDEARGLEFLQDLAPLYDACAASGLDLVVVAH